MARIPYVRFNFTTTLLKFSDDASYVCRQEYLCNSRINRLIFHFESIQLTNKHYNSYIQMRTRHLLSS